MTENAKPILPKPERDNARPEVVDLGDDGTYEVCYGHVDPTTFVCLMIAHQADLIGVDDKMGVAAWFDHDVPVDTLAAFIDAVLHTWATEHVAAPDDRPPGVSVGDSFLRWEDQKAEPGAFPITVLDLEL